MSNTNENAHEERDAHEERMREQISELSQEVRKLTNELEQSREVAREEAQRAETRRDEIRAYYEERMTTQRERLYGEIQAKQERLDQVLATDQGTAYAEVEEMKRLVATHEARAERAEGRAQQAESDKARALASVEGGDIHPDDPRVAHIWRKASRLATANQFCGEYDKIAEALGLPEVEFDYSGTVSVRVSGYVTVPVSGRATRREIADHEIEPDISTDDILENLEHGSIDWEIDEMEIEAEDE